MQTWSNVKKQKSPPTINELIEQILSTKREKSQKGIDFFAERKDAEMHQQKMQKKKER